VKKARPSTNVSPPGEGHQAQYHSSNLLSCVYYVVVPEGADKIVFRDPRVASQIISPHIRSDAPAPPRAVSLNVVPGRIVAFPSWLEHLVPINRSDGLRISIAFNVINKDFVQATSPPQWSGIPIQEDSDCYSMICSTFGKNRFAEDIMVQSRGFPDSAFF
jgi:hypothetical protein